VSVEFVEPEELPLPSDQVRIRGLEVEVYPDGRRLLVELQLTPFRERPRVDFVVTDNEGHEVVETSVVEATDPVMRLTLHLPSDSAAGMYTLESRIVYPEQEEVDRSSRQFAVSN
jgi:hypothetical protein